VVVPDKSERVSWLWVQGWGLGAEPFEEAFGVVGDDGVYVGFGESLPDVGGVGGVGHDEKSGVVGCLDLGGGDEAGVGAEEVSCGEACDFGDVEEGLVGVGETHQLVVSGLAEEGG